MTFILALDQGTTSSRAILFDEHGIPRASAAHEFPQHYPRPGLVEHDPERIWDSQLRSAREAIEKAGVSPADIHAIGITNQRETTLLWDRATGTPVAPAIVWQDRRTARLCDELRSEGLERHIKDTTGLVIDPYFSGTKLHWLLQQTPGALERARRGELAFGTVDTWLMYRLSGGRTHATDVTNASRTMIFDIGTLDWDDALLERLDIPREILPEVRPSAGTFGTTARDVLGAEIPITGVAGDQQAALFGQACFEPGMAKNTYGTGSFVVMNTGTERAGGDGVLTTVAWQIDGQSAHYALEASIFVTGAAVQWLRDELGVIESAADIEPLAASAPDNGGVYFVPALAGLGSPHWDPYARGVIVGLTRGSTKAHLARATLESIAYQTRDGIEAMRAASSIELQELRVDGGASVNDLLMQIQADVLQAPVVRPDVTEVTALGAAYLAGIGAGLWTTDELSSRWKLERRFEPTADANVVTANYERWKRAVERSRAWETP